MKLYNPFKPHVCTNNRGEFIIRVWFFGWMYYTGCRFQLDLFEFEVYRALTSDTEEGIIKEFQKDKKRLKDRHEANLKNYNDRKWRKL